jgi:hypothetical protein
MAKVQKGRYTAAPDDDLIVYLIGMRINKPWKPHKWLPVFVAMPRMLRWLDKHPEAGLLNWHLAWINGPAVVQYWRSFEALNGFAGAAGQPHLPAWKSFNKAIRASGDVGVWHEAYPVHVGEQEAMYVNMPPVGLAAATHLQPVGSTGQTYAQRVGLADAPEPAVAPYDNP